MHEPQRAAFIQLRVCVRTELLYCIVPQEKKRAPTLHGWQILIYAVN